MDLAASTVGFVSLGLQVADGLIAYLDAVKDRRAELEAAAEQAARLSAQLRDVEALAARAPGARLGDAAGGVRACAAGCEKQLRRLEEFLVEVGGGAGASPPPSGAPPASRLAEAVTRIRMAGMYPFRRAKVEALQRRLDSTNAALGTALATLSGFLASAVSEDLSTVLASSRSLASQVSDMAGTTGDGIARAELALRDQSRQLERSLPLLEREVASVRGTVDALHSAQLASAPAVGVEDLDALLRRRLGEHERRTLGSMLLLLGCTAGESLDEDVLIRRMGAKPAALRSVADALGGPDALAMASAQAHRNTRHPDRQLAASASRYQALVSTCRCKTRVHSRAEWGQFAFHKERLAREHMPGCPRFGIPPQGSKSTYRLSWSGLASLVSRAVEITFSVHSGAGAWGFGPQLAVYRWVDEQQDPAFALTSVLNQYAVHVRIQRGKLSPELVQSYFLRLENAYRSGRSRVTDYTDHDMTVLGAILFNSVGWVARRDIRNVVLPILSAFVSNWCLATGSRVWGRSTLALLLEFNYSFEESEGRWLQMCDALFARSDETLEEPPLMPLKAVCAAASTSESIRDVLCLSPVETAIVQRDMKELQRLERHIWDPQYSTNVMQMTPLHLAARWLDGLQMLLSTAPEDIINTEDLMLPTALAHALEASEETCRERGAGVVCRDCDCYRPVELLLRHGAVWRFAAPNGSVRAQVAMLECLKERCIEFQRLVFKRGWFGDDHHAHERLDMGLQAAYRAVKEAGIALPPVLDLQFRDWKPVYCWIQDAAVAEVAYQLGFRDVAGYVPPHPVVSWFLDHGMSLTAPYRRGMVVAHMILGKSARYDSEEDRALLLRILGAGAPLRISDGCACKCTSGGCYPLTFFILEAYRHGRLGFLDLLEASGADLTRDSWMPYHCIRALTLQEFEMVQVHTCCRQRTIFSVPRQRTPEAGWKRVDIDALVVELEQAFKEGHQTFRDFMEGTWEDRIKDVLASMKQRGSLDEEEKNRLAEFGGNWVPHVSLREEEEEGRKKDPGYWRGLMDDIIPELGQG